MKVTIDKTVVSIEFDDGHPLEFDPTVNYNSSIWEAYRDIALLVTSRSHIYDLLDNNKCSGITTKKIPCRRNPYFVVGSECYCNTHLPPKAKQALHEHLSAKIEEKRYQLALLEKKLSQNFEDAYNELKVFRNNPPSEYTGWLLLNWLQKGKCYICKNQENLVDDHDHKTGMVRALLCRSCNILEGKRHGLFWTSYRKYAPGNGLFIRYTGMFAEWTPGWPDPLPNRLIGETEKNSPGGVILPINEEGECHVFVKEYVELAENTPPRKIPTSAYRKFDVCGRPLLLAGEEYLPIEKRIPENGRWPIK